MTKKITVINANNTYETKKIRTIIYARVSTEKCEQLTSFNAQLEYYKKIYSNSEYELLGIFKDYGISGMSVKNRTGFNEMIEFCKNCHVDLIVTKSISRFSRNTKDFLENIRLLKNLNTSVFFEKENINTLTEESELILSILASFSQEESINISKNMKWRIKKSFENGDYIPSFLPYGYFRENDEIKVNEKEALVVRNIYNLYLDGKSCVHIAKYLSEKGIKTRTNKDIWHYRTVVEMLKNEFYTGNLLMQKNFTPDKLPLKCVKNKGQLPMYYIKNNHTAIISNDDFLKVKNILSIKGKIPAGYYIKNGEVIASNDSEIIETIFNKFCEFKDIHMTINYLKDNNIYFYNKNKWTLNLIKSVLKNDKYIGSDFYEQIICEDIFEKTQKILNEI